MRFAFALMILAGVVLASTVDNRVQCRLQRKPEDNAVVALKVLMKSAMNTLHHMTHVPGTEKVVREGEPLTEGTIKPPKPVYGSCVRCGYIPREQNTFEARCPFCNHTSFSWCIKDSPCDEGEFTCNNCDADFCGKCGYEKISTSNKHLKLVFRNRTTTLSEEMTLTAPHSHSHHHHHNHDHHHHEHNHGDLHVTKQPRVPEMCEFIGGCKGEIAMETLLKLAVHYGFESAQISSGLEAAKEVLSSGKAILIQYKAAANQTPLLVSGTAAHTESGLFTGVVRGFETTESGEIKYFIMNEVTDSSLCGAKYSPESFLDAWKTTNYNFIKLF